MGTVGTILALGVLLPATVAAVVAAVLGRVSAMRAGPAASLGLAAGYVAGHVGVVGWPGWAPVDVTHRLPHLAVLAGGLGLTAWNAPVGYRRLAPAVAGPVVAGVLLGPLEARLEPPTFLGAAVGGALVLTGLAALWGRATREQPPIAAGVALVLAATFVAITSAASGSLVVGQLSGTVAAAAAALAVTAHSTRPAMALDTMATAAAVVLGGLAVLAVAYSSTPAVALIPWALMPLALWGVRAAIGGRLRGARAIAVQGLALLLLGAAAVTWAALATAPTDATEEGSRYDYAYD